ncbi:hypothetical protein [Limosilactobacillus reuteri]|uniref:hypothetical protein n=1 Tax=Limosilactobacillus reuteri TaxID=1598 RepID=UPI003AF170E5
MIPIFSIRTVIDCLQIITPVFKSKASDFKKHAFTARPAVKINVNEVELTIFKGTNVSSPYPHV